MKKETMVFEAHGISFPCTELLLINYAKVKTVFSYNGTFNFFLKTARFNNVEKLTMILHYIAWFQQLWSRCSWKCAGSHGQM